VPEAPSLRLIHITDLHFGGQLSTPWWHLPSHIPGLELHSEIVAQSLSDTIRYEMKRCPMRSRVVVTGDLTTTGDDNALSLALTYIRGQISAGARTALGLNASDAALIPGNHDVWSGVILGLGQPRSNFDRWFADPAPDVVGAGDSPPHFPYRLDLTGNLPVPVYFYGLDSTRVELSPSRLGAVHHVLAQGYVDEAQMVALQDLILDEPVKGPALRVAAIHHPIAYLPGYEESIKLLLNLKQVRQFLSDYGFSIVLCGHQHRGFTKPYRRSPGHRVLHVLSAGTATQTVRLSEEEERLLATSPHRLSADDQRRWFQSAIRCNEFRFYEFQCQSVEPPIFQLTTRVFRYRPELLGFLEDYVRQPKPILLDLS
jgi:3',5'-cyclic AMP phosphodiesterase CpdA